MTDLRVFLKHSLLLLCVFTLHGCVFSPGMDMRDGVRKGDGVTYIQIDGSNKLVPIIDIDENLTTELTVDKLEPRIPIQLLNVKEIEEYKIGANDGLVVVVWGQDELMGNGNAGPLIVRHVREDGNFFYPYAGLVNAEGKTREQVRIVLTEKLKKYFKDPQVDVSIEEYNSQRVILSGQFVSPQTLPLTAVPMTLSQAVSSGGGPSTSADLTDFQINRKGKIYSLNYHKLAAKGAIHNIRLQDGDVLHLPPNQSNSAYVVGEVARPQKIGLWTGRITLTDALASAGGLSPMTSSGNEVYVVRGVDTIAGEKAIYRLDAKSPSAYLLSSQFEIRPQDVIFVGPAELTKWNRIISQLFPFTRFVDAVQSIESN